MAATSSDPVEPVEAEAESDFDDFDIDIDAEDLIPGDGDLMVSSWWWNGDLMGFDGMISG